MAAQYSNQFFAVPTEFARDPDIPPRAAKVYLYLAAHPGKRNLPIQDIAANLRMGRNTVARALRDLEHAGYIQNDQEEVGAHG